MAILDLVKKDYKEYYIDNVDALLSCNFKIGDIVTTNDGVRTYTVTGVHLNVPEYKNQTIITLIPNGDISNIIAERLDRCLGSFKIISKHYNFKVSDITADGVKISKKDCVITYNQIKADIKDCIYAPNLGFILKTDSNIISKNRLEKCIITHNYFSLHYWSMKSVVTFNNEGSVDLNNQEYYLEGLPTPFTNFTIFLHEERTTVEIVTTEEVLKSYGYILSYKDDVYYKPEDLKYSKQRRFIEFNYLKFKFDTKEEAKAAGAVSTSFLAFNGLKNTYGVEIEMSEGFIPERIGKKFNIRIEKDGSVFTDEDNKTGDTKYGPECISSVLQGDAGLVVLQELICELGKRAKINSTAGIHIHIGGCNFSKKNIVLLYKLGLMVQKDIQLMLPRSRRSNNNEYCRNLPKIDLDFDSTAGEGYTKMMIDMYYETIFKLSCGRNPDNTFNSTTNHPKGAKVGYDHSNIRYCWLNLIPAIFNTRENMEAKTVEFRNHSASLNFTKIKNWIKICMALVNYVEMYPDKVMYSNSNITIEEIVEAVYKGLNKDNILKYVITRKELLASEKYSEKEQEYLEPVDTNKMNKKQIITECV